jgi:hypothetical protein
MASREDWQVASTSQASSGRQRSAFDVLSVRPPKCPQPTICGPGSRGKSADKAARLYSRYYQHFEPVDRVLYPESAQNLHGIRGRLFLDNAEMACKWCEDQEDRYTVTYKPSTNLKHHLLKSCAGFHKSDHWTDPDVVRSLSELASKVLCLRSRSYFSSTCVLLMHDGRSSGRGLG